MYPRGVKMNMKKIVVAGGGVLGSQIASICFLWL